MRAQVDSGSQREIIRRGAPAGAGDVIIDLTGDEPVVRPTTPPPSSGGFGEGPLAHRVGVDPIDDLVRRAVALAAEAARRAAAEQLAASAAPSVH